MPNKVIQYARGITNNNQQNFRRLAGWYRAMHGLDQAAIATAPIPVVGDVVGLAADIRTFKEEPSWANAGWLAAGTVVPFVGGKALKEGVEAVLGPGEVVNKSKHFEDLQIQNTSNRHKAQREKFQKDTLSEYQQFARSEDAEISKSFLGKKLLKQRDDFLGQQGLSIDHIDSIDSLGRTSGVSPKQMDQISLYLRKRWIFLNQEKLNISDEEISKVLNAGTKEVLQKLEKDLL